jgi:LCP family protein required for cell wall assembly
MNCAVGYPEWLHIPLENGQDYPNCLNYLWRSAAASPNNFFTPPFDPSQPYQGTAECQAHFDCERAWRALTGAIQNLANQQIDGVVAVNLKGFVALVEALPGHGVWIDVPYALHDDVYHDSQQNPIVVDFQAGCQFLDGEQALAFARSRHQDSDYQRARRQQIFLQQVRKQLDPLAMLGSLGNLINAAKENLFMTFSQPDFPYLAQIASHVDADRLYRYDFAPNQLSEFNSIDDIARKVSNIFSEPEPTPPNKNEPPCPNN